MRNIRISWSLCVVWFAFLVPALSLQTANANSPIGVEFDLSTLTRVGHNGDNWCQTWAADDSVITAMDDGNWNGTSGPPIYHSRLYKITGESNSFTKTEIDGYPYFDREGDGWFAYGTLSVDGVLYSLVSKTQGANWSAGPFRGMKLLRSYDSGDTWYRVDKNNQDRYLDPSNSEAARESRERLTDAEMFFFEENGRDGKGRTAYPFGFATFVQNGQDHSASQDGYVYIYSPEGANSHQLLLARVLASQVGLRSAWEYFSGWDNGIAQWSSDIEERQPNLLLPEKNASGEYFGWYSWLPSVVWNPGLQLYIMANGGTYAGDGLSNSGTDYYDRWMHTKTGSLGLWYSESPYGPWQQFYYNDYWTVDDAANLTYQPKLSPKWMSDDGRKMTLIWSDAMRNAKGNSHAVNYKWNQMEIDIVIEDGPPPPEPPPSEIPTLTLRDNTWHQLSLPCDPGENNTVEALFGDDNLGTDWTMWAFDSALGNYQSVNSDTPLVQGAGYWIIQNSGDTRELDMPADCAVTPRSTNGGCPADTGCFATPITGAIEGDAWQLLGYPFAYSGNASQSSIVTSDGSCVEGCAFGSDDANLIIAPDLWTYDGDGFTGHWRAAVQAKQIRNSCSGKMSRRYSVSRSLFLN